MARPQPKLVGILPQRYYGTEFTPQGRSDEEAALAIASPQAIIELLRPLVDERRAARIDEVAASRLSGVVVVLEDLHDPHNGGAVLRSCEAMGLREVRIIASRERFRVSDKVTQGADKWLDVVEHPSTDSALETLRQRGFTLAAAVPGATTQLTELDPHKPIALLMGVYLRWLRPGRIFEVSVIGLALLLATAIPASAAEIMRVTFIRHGESVGNASGLMDGSIPGPVLTDLGSQQARAVAEKLGDNNYDAIYASTMVRTQLTAAPMSQYLGLPINVVYGLRELDTGKFEGTPEANAPALMAYPMAWVFQGNLDAAIPDVDGNPVLDGHMFQDRVNGALQTMYDNGDRNVAAFSHGGTIMFWTLMNASNLTVQQKMDLLRNSSLKNTDYVVVEGNNEDGWVLVDWNGQKFAPEPTFFGAIGMQTRTLVRQLSATVNDVVAAFQTGDIVTISSPTLGTLANRVNHCTQIEPWSLGTGALMRNLSKRGLL